MLGLWAYKWLQAKSPPFSPGTYSLGSLPPPASLAAIDLSRSAVLSQVTPSVTASIPSLPLPTSSLPSPPPAQQANLHPPSSSRALSSIGGFSLSISTPLVPERIVQQILAGRYVEMRDLLGDNMAVRRHFEDIQGSLGSNVVQIASSRPRVREVSTIPSWVCCFLTFLAVGTSDPVVRERLAYAVLLVREAMRHGGQGWIEYDRLFRQQAAMNPSLPWNVLHAGLQASTILGGRSPGAGTFCTLCQECDHSNAQCALTQLQQQPVNNPGRAPARWPGRICSSWNDGACIFPGACTYRHICSNCRLPGHPAKDCRRARSSASSSRPTTTLSHPSAGEEAGRPTGRV